MRVRGRSRNNAESYGIALGEFNAELLDQPADAALLTALGEFPRIVTTAAELRAPHRIAHYLESLAGVYHRWYDTKECRVTPQGDAEVTPCNRTRVWLNEATNVVLANGLGLLGLSAPERIVMSRTAAHPAGPRHSDGAVDGHPVAAADINALDAKIWPTSSRRIDGVVEPRRHSCDLSRHNPWDARHLPGRSGSAGAGAGVRGCRCRLPITQARRSSVLRLLDGLPRKDLVSTSVPVVELAIALAAQFQPTGSPCMATTSRSTNCAERSRSESGTSSSTPSTRSIV